MSRLASDHLRVALAEREEEYADEQYIEEEEVEYVRDNIPIQEPMPEEPFIDEESDNHFIWEDREEQEQEESFIYIKNIYMYIF